MNLELDHFFILVEPGAEVAERLIEMGMEEGASNHHPGQGTSNRRFFLSNGMLELLWVRDAEEAEKGPASKLRFPERATNPNASPFGVIFRRKSNSDLQMPFTGWTYQPDYFDPPWSFHIGENSEVLSEPLCIYVPFIEPNHQEPESGTFKSITQVKIMTPAEPLSEALHVSTRADRLSIEQGDEHLMEVTFDNGRLERTCDLRPNIPLIIYW